MYTSFYRACLLYIGFVFSFTVHAAGLGEITINSSLGQPLNAEINLVAVNEDELSSLQANLASYEAFAQAGIRLEPFFSSLKISIDTRVNGQPYVKITSPQAINEPFLSLLIELSWSTGRLLREYTVLLDPAEAQRPDPIAPIVPPVQEDTSAIAENRAEPITQDIPQADPPPVERQIEQVSPPETILPASASNTYGPILKGDTLSSIARQIKPDSVNLNQMLVALFRANREAFIADNMNLLRTGVTLKIPDFEEVAVISENEANQEVRIQVSDWRKYRQDLALSRQQSQETEDLDQMVTGEITTAVDDAAAATGDESPEEVLRLSSGEALSDSDDSAVAMQERLRMMEEDAIARNLALQEANERVAMLEKNIENLQQVLSLENSDLAQAQLNAQAQAEELLQQAEAEEVLEVIQSESSDPYATELDLLSEDDMEIGFDDMTETDATLLQSTDPGLEGDFEGETLTALAPSTPAQAVTNPILLPESEPEETSFLDQIMGNLTYIGAAFAVLLLILFALILRRRRAAAEEAELEESRYEELSSALRSKTAAAVAAVHVDEQQADQHDAFDETEDNKDFDLTYGHDNDQTESLKQDASDADQSFELDFSKENNQAESEIETVTETEDLTHESTVFPEPQVEQSNEFAQEKTEEAFDFDTDPSGSSDSFDQDLKETVQADEQPVEEENNEINQDFTLDFESEKKDVDPIEPDKTLSMETDDTDGLTDTAQDDLHGVALDAELDQVDAKPDDDHMLDFSSDLTADTSGERSEPEAVVQEEASTPIEDEGLEKPTVDFSDISLDIEDTAETSENQPDDLTNEAEEPDSSEPVVKSEQWHEIETKIDLAKAYIEMEDIEGAKEMLEEVVQEGDAQQQNTANTLLEKL